jgi:hypothetical protein
MISQGRDESGRFAQGNAGGPGRPRRSVEVEYLATLGDMVSLEDWAEVVARALADAKSGDANARAWLAKHLLGGSPSTLMNLAAQEQRGATPDADIDALSAKQQVAADSKALFDQVRRQMRASDC